MNKKVFNDDDRKLLLLHMNPMIISVACVASVSVDGIFCPKNPISVLERKKKNEGEGKAFPSSPLPARLLHFFVFHLARIQIYENQLFSAENSMDKLASQAIISVPSEK